MTLLHDRIVVVDVEATCWRKSPPPDEQMEIIEVGISTLDLQTHQPWQKRSILVRPTRSKISRYCTRLTTLTQEQVNDGETFANACAALVQDFGSKERLWASWGDFDRKIFAAQCQVFDVAYPFSEHHLNVKTLFAEAFNLKRTVGMARALKMLELPLEGTHHRGHDDAWNIAVLLGKVLGKIGNGVLDNYGFAPE